MKLTEKILRAPLPDQLKALLEKFDGDFDASHLRALKNLADEETFTWYERHMLKRAHKMARVKLERGHALNAAMTVVLNLKEEDQHSGWYSNPAQNPYVTIDTKGRQNPYVTIDTKGRIALQQQLDQHAQIIKSDLQRSLLGMPR
jgi:hypothetical protein